MKLKYFVLPFLCAAMLSCGHSTESALNTKDETTTAELQLSRTMETNNHIPSNTSADTTAINSDHVYNGSQPIVDWDKKIIKTATIQIECKLYRSYNQQLHALVKQYGGWLASESEVQEPNRINNTVSIKVPVAQFEDLLIAINGLDGKTLQKNIVTEDVTGQVVDTKGRIAVRKEMRDKYMNMLNRTSKMEDVLQVQSKIDDIHEEIEMAATRLESLQHQSAYSTVNINFYQLLDVAPVDEDAVKTPGFGSRILSAAANGGSWIADLFVGLVSIWPLLLAGALAIYFIRKKAWQTATIKNKDVVS